MATPGTYEALRSAKTIGSSNLAAWSTGYDVSEYLNVLPNENVRLSMDDSWSQWQRGNREHLKGIYSKTSTDGSYHSSWGPSKNLNLTLRMSTLDRQTIQGLGRIMANKDGGRFDSVYDTSFWKYNKQSPGPLLVANPGDSIKIKLVNDLDVEAEILASNEYAYKTNLHGHGLHVSPGGNSDNVLLKLKPGKTWDVSWDLPKDHMSGLNWSHPHYHGGTSLSIAKGLALPLVILPESSESAKTYDPTKESIFLLNLQSWALAQQERESSPTDPLNQDPSGESWAIGTPPQKFTDAEGDYYKYSPARFNGNNYYPVQKYNPQNPLTYGDAVGLMPNENVVHTANGYYNPTLEVETGKWATFMFENMTLNSTHIIQLIRRDESGNLTLESTNILGTDSDLSHWVAPEEIDQLPILMPGGRVGIQHAFSKPGEYFFITNGTNEVLGDLAPALSNVSQGNGSNYLGFNDGFQIAPSQVLATVQVSGEAIAAVPSQPKPWKSLFKQYERSQELRADVSKNGVDKERTFEWLTGPPKGTEFNDPATWEETWTINNQYWSHAADEQPTLTTTMLGTVERWNVNNLSAGRVTSNLSGSETYNVVGQSHPFHIHTNEFLIESINGLKISSDPSLNQGGDSFFSTYLDNLLLGPRYIEGTATSENPYGLPGSAGSADKPFEADLLLEFKDYPGLFVDHCHLLFHEDAGMMVAVQTILNTDSSWLVSGAQQGQNRIQVSMASGINEALEWQPYAAGDKPGKAGINVSSGDINADPNKFQSGLNGNTTNVTDNVADVATLQKTLALPTDRFSIQIYDGAALKQDWSKGRSVSPDPLWTIDPFKSNTASTSATTDLAVGDINGDGFADVVASLGGKRIDGVVEIFSGKDQKLLARLNPFADSKERTSINLAVGDIDADGYSDIVTGQGKGGSGRVEVFSGLSLYEQLQKSNKDFLTGRSVTRKASLLDDTFKPYGENYSGSVDVAASYALPRGFDNDQVHQTPSANITTLAVGVSGGASNPSIRNFLFLGDNHSSDVEDHGSHEASGLNATIPMSVKYTSGYNTSRRYVDLQAQYIDLPTGLRGEATIMASTRSGRQDLLYLPETSLQSGDNMMFDSTIFRWNPSSLG
jgi:FtsP/CotA-like multicopper oxidase with cupredoxin domain